MYRELPCKKKSTASESSKSYMNMSEGYDQKSPKISYPIKIMPGLIPWLRPRNFSGNSRSKFSLAYPTVQTDQIRCNFWLFLILKKRLQIRRFKRGETAVHAYEIFERVSSEEFEVIVKEKLVQQ